jgi:hypothetical protein
VFRTQVSIVSYTKPVLLVNRAMKSIRWVSSYLSQVNWFIENNKEVKNTPEKKRQQVSSTWVYIVLLTVSLIILVLFVSLSKTTVFITETKPSINTFQRLQAAYPNSLACPCEHISVSSKAFLSIIPKYHQVRQKN